MSVYKQVRKKWLKRLTKKQRKQLKGYVQDIADTMLEAYSETLRLNGRASTMAGFFMPIADTHMEIFIDLKLTPRF